jgi:hypothetical protein
MSHRLRSSACILPTSTVALHEHHVPSLPRNVSRSAATTISELFHTALTPRRSPGRDYSSCSRPLCARFYLSTSSSLSSTARSQTCWCHASSMWCRKMFRWPPSRSTIQPTTKAHHDPSKGKPFSKAIFSRSVSIVSFVFITVSR